eukprot:XP_003730936.2 PREDICTED: uncharacterized protein LOC100890283 [Strongylocentrotus purpuratus]
MDVSGSEEEEKNDEEIDVLSPNFNPLKALYASNVTLPVADASIFNNLAEYERFMSKDEEETKGQEQKCAPPSRRALERRHLEHMREKEKELPRSTYQQRKMFQLNVISRMESEHTKESPLDLLRQCVEKRCKVRVCIRSFKGLRSICIGYLVAFDKIWNMALTDVVEIYKRPSTGKRFHHEEKVTYSMIMSNLNPPPKKPDPPKPSEQEQKGAGGKKRAKECKFCRIKHEALMEQRAASDSRDTEASQDWSNSESSSSGTDEYSSTEESESDGEKEVDKVKMEKARRKQKTPRRPSRLCPNGHERLRTQSRRPQSSKSDDSQSSKKDFSGANVAAESTSKISTSSVAKRMTLESSDSLWTAASSSGPRLAEGAGKSTKEGASVKESVSMATASTRESKTSSAKAKNSSSSNLSDTRKSDLLLSRMTTSATNQESSTLSSHTSTTASSTSKTSSTPSSVSKQTSKSRTSSAPSRSSSSKKSTASSSSLSQAFSKTLTIGREPVKLTDVKSQDGKETKTMKEVVHLDPKTGKRLIQPEEFKRRHVNQLFIRGDQVVLVSVDSDMVEVDLKKAAEKSEEKSSVEGRKGVKQSHVSFSWS